MNFSQKCDPRRGSWFFTAIFIQIKINGIPDSNDCSSETNKPIGARKQTIATVLAVACRSPTRDGLPSFPCRAVRLRAAPSQSEHRLSSVGPHIRECLHTVHPWFLG